MSDHEGRVALIQKLLTKASAAGTTPAEREAFSQKATQLMLQWGIEDAMIDAAAGNTRTENIIVKQFRVDAPKTYSYEFTTIGIQVAHGLGCKGFLYRQGTNVDLSVVGYESDVERVGQLFQSLTQRCTHDLAYAVSHDPRWSSYDGTEKFQFKRAFVSGFAVGICENMARWKTEAVAQTGNGAELVLVDRSRRISAWIGEHITTSKGRGRRSYAADARGQGRAAGLRADVGATKIGDSGRGRIGR